jgi:hypothetical protein
MNRPNLIAEAWNRLDLLRWSLRANGLFSVTSGLVFTVFAAAVTDRIGLPDPRVIGFVGLNLLGFAAFLFWVSSRPAIHLPTAMAIVYLDLAWVAGTVPLVAAGWLSESGNVLALAIAEGVLTFALLQWLGVRRERRSLQAEALA